MTVMKTANKWIALIACMLIVSLPGCKSGNQQNPPPAATAENSGNPAATPQPSANQPAPSQAGGNEQPTTGPNQPAPPPQPAPPKEESIAVPEGTTLSVRLVS